MSSHSSHQTALCLIPPENVWDQIQEIRSVHDKAFPRWMPHINFIYPFAPESEFDKIQERLENSLGEIDPFEIEFDESSFEYFTQRGSSCTFHLRPKSKNETVQLYKIISKILAEFVTSTKPFEAHLTLGQTTTSRISDKIIELKAKWKRIQFRVDRIFLISREKNPEKPFEIIKEIFLKNQSQNFQREKSTENLSFSPREEILPEKISKKFSLCVVPPEDFSKRIEVLFERTSLIKQKPFRIVLAEFQTIDEIEKNFQEQISRTNKFSLNFGSRSICFNYETMSLFLKPIDLAVFDRFQWKSSSFNGNLLLGSLDKNDVSQVCELYTDRWTFGTDDFDVNFLHLIDENGRICSSYSLQRQSFS